MDKFREILTFSTLQVWPIVYLHIHRILCTLQEQLKEAEKHVVMPSINSLQPIRNSQKKQNHVLKYNA